jgi:hypothetical protein
MKIIRTYRELSQLLTFEERYEYLKLSSIIGDKTFGFERYLNQEFYRSPEWKRVRREVIIRDNGCDLGIEGRDIIDRIEIHHITPISLEDFENGSPLLLDLNNLICTSPSTHKAIHYGEANLITPSEPTIRRPNDTCPWK